MFIRKVACRTFCTALLASQYWAFAGVPVCAQEVTGLLRPGLDTGLQTGVDNLPSSDASAIGADDTGTQVANGVRLSTFPNNSIANQRAFASGPEGQISSNGGLQASANQPVSTVQGGGKSREENPYDAVGLPIGHFRLFPVFEQSFGATTNADETANGQSSTFSVSDGRVVLQSGWSRHELRGELGFRAQKFFNGESETRIDADARADLRFDVRDGWAVRLGVGYDQSTESPTTDALSGGGISTVSNRPTVREFGGSLGVERSGGKLNGSIKATVDRSTFGTVKFDDGTSAAQDERDSIEWKATGRLSYQLSPTLSPFVETSAGRRIFDEKFDSDGIRRDASLFDLRGGIAVDLGEKLRGEVALGYGIENYDDVALSNLGGLTLNGSIEWSPQRFTTITTTAETEFEGSSGLNDPSSITYRVGLSAERRIRTDLSIDGRISADWQSDEAGGNERTFQVEAGATWYLNRWAAIVGRLGYKNVDSSEADESYDAATARIGLRLQR